MNDRASALPLLVLAALCVGFVADVLLTANQLPARLATHFGADGLPNGWMTRSGHVRFTLGFGLGLPVFILALAAVITRLGGKGLNIPHRDYWLAPERRAQTLAAMQRMLVWFSCLLVGFFTLIHHSILLANAQTPVRLSSDNLWMVLAPFVTAIGTWAVMFIRPFMRKA